MAKTKGDFKLTTEPADGIAFEGPFDKEVKVDLKLINTDDKKRAFKVKCTNNDLFKIRPAVGKLDAKGSATVSITCKPAKTEDARKAEHHFNVYHILIEKEEEPRKAWAAKKDPEGTKTLPVTFKGDDKDKKAADKDKKEDEKKDDKKEKEEEKKEDKEEKKEEDKKDEEKKDEEKKEEKKEDEKKEDEEKKDE